MIYLFSIIGSIWATVTSIKYFFICSSRIDIAFHKNFLEIVKQNQYFVFNDNFVLNDEQKEYNGFVIWNNIWMVVHAWERELKAGYQPTETMLSITYFRWNKKKIDNNLKSLIDPPKQGTEINLVNPNYLYNIGFYDSAYEPIIEESKYKDLENDIIKIKNGELNKTGAILYGPPGNGKTSLIKYFGVKYNLPINLISFEKDFNNRNILNMIHTGNKNSILVFEDFDNIFDNRTPIGEVKYTFDMILNCLDGLYANYKNCVIIFTANDINKISDALYDRPGRLKYLIHVDNPNENETKKVIGDFYKITKGKNLDQLFKIKYLLKDKSIEQIVEELTI